MVRSLLWLAVLAAAAIGAVLVEAPARAQLIIGPTGPIGPVEPAEPLTPFGAYLSVPRPDGSEEEGRPFLHPHFYEAGANALEFELAIRREYDYSQRYRTPVERHRGARCPWWADEDDADSECGKITFEDDWSHVQVTAYLPDADGEFKVAFGASEGIGPKTGTFCETTGGTAIPGSVCVISKADWKTAQGASADGDAAMPLRLVLTTGAAESRNVEVDAVVWSARDTAIAGSKHRIHLQPDRGVQPELFFYKTDEQHHYLPCTSAEMAAEDMGECDPPVTDGEIVNIGLTITNGPSGENGIDHAVIGHTERRDHQRRFLDFDRILFEWDGPAVILHARPLRGCHPHGTLAAGGECTLMSEDWFDSYALGSYSFAFAHDDSVGHLAVAFAVLPTETPTDHEITAKLYREPVPGDGVVTETPETASITIEGATAPSRPTIYAITDEIGNEVDLLIGSPRHFDWLLFGYDIETTYAGPALFKELAATGTALTVNADRGTFRMWGRRCEPSSSGCSLAFTREEMKRGYDSNREPGQQAIPTGAGSNEHRVPLRAKLYYFAPFDEPGPAIITATVSDAQGVGHGKEHVHPYRNTSALRFEVRTPQDADGILEPGQTTEVHIGFAFATSGSPADDPVLGTDLSVECDEEHETHFCDLVNENVLDPDGSWFALGPGAQWAPPASGRRLTAAGGDFKCRADEEESGAGLTAYFCAYGTGRGTAADPRRHPELTVNFGAGEEVQLTASLQGLQGRRILLDDWYHRGLHRRWHQGEPEYFTTATLRTGTVEQVSSAQLRRANDESGPIRTGSTAALELGVLSESGFAARIGAISSITVTAAEGGLYGPYCSGATERGSASTVCSISPFGSITAAAKADPGLPGKIPIRFAAPDEEGAASVTATVAPSSWSLPLNPDPLTIEFTGDATKLSLASGVPRVHRIGTPDEGEERDDRDVIELAAEALDSMGRATALPETVRMEIRGPDGELAGEGIIETVDCRVPGAGENRSRCRFVLDVEAPAEQPLATGLYSFTARAGDGVTAEASFGVSGKAASISAVPGEIPEIGGMLEVEITVLDAEGQPVADGTEVRITAEGPSPGEAGSLQASSPADGIARTANGKATATFVATWEGLSILRLQAGGKGAEPDATASAIVDMRREEEARRPSELLAIRGDAAAGGFAGWQGRTIAASELLADLPEEAALWLWNGWQWLPYRAGTPGSRDLLIAPGDVLWIGGAER